MIATLILAVAEVALNDHALFGVLGIALQRFVQLGQIVMGYGRDHVVG